MTFQIERLGFEELCAFLHIQAEDTFPDLKNEERLKMLAEKWSQNAECSTCRDDKALILGMIAFYANVKGADIAYIPHVYILPNYRHQGLFGQMLQRIETYVKQKGFTKLKLEVNSENVTAKCSYLKQGFVEVAIASEKSVYMIKSI